MRVIRRLPQQFLHKPRIPRLMRIRELSRHRINLPRRRISRHSKHRRKLKINRLMELPIKRVHRTMLKISIKIPNKTITTSQLPSKAITTLNETSRVSLIKKKMIETQTSSHNSSNSPRIDSLATMKVKVSNNSSRPKEVLAMKVSF